MKNLMKECETKGMGGGELAENDLEALKKSINKVPENSFNEIALIVEIMLLLKIWLY